MCKGDGVVKIFSFTKCSYSILKFNIQHNIFWPIFLLTQEKMLHAQKTCCSKTKRLSQRPHLLQFKSEKESIRHVDLELALLYKQLWSWTTFVAHSSHTMLQSQSSGVRSTLVPSHLALTCSVNLGKFLTLPLSSSLLIWNGNKNRTCLIG